MAEYLAMRSIAAQYIRCTLCMVSLADNYAQKRPILTRLYWQEDYVT